MSLVLSTDLAKDALASESGLYKVWLLTLEHKTFPQPYRFASDGKEVYDFDPISGDPIYKFVSRGMDFIVCPFSLILPESQVGNAIPKAKLQIANATPEISKALQEISTSMSITSEFVFAHEPDKLANILPKFYLADVEITQTVASGTLMFKNFFDNIVPSITLVPSIFPGMFK